MLWRWVSVCGQRIDSLQDSEEECGFFLGLLSPDGEGQNFGIEIGVVLYCGHERGRIAFESDGHRSGEEDSARH